MYLYNHPNTYRDVAQYHQIEDAVVNNSTEDFAGNAGTYPIVYGTPVATQFPSVSSANIVQSKFLFPLSAPAKLVQDELSTSSHSGSPDEQHNAPHRNFRHRDDDGFIEGENVMEDIRDVGTFAVGSSGGKNELRIKEEEEEAKQRSMEQAYRSGVVGEALEDEGEVYYGEREGAS